MSRRILWPTTLATLGILAIALVACAPPPSPAATPASAQVAPSQTPARPTPTVVPQPSPPTLTLQWFGQSTFLLMTSNGTRVLMDPTNRASGYTIPPFNGVDVVTISHEHADHNNLDLAPGAGVVIRGLKDGDWAQIDQTVKDVKLRTVPTYHDSESGTKRGKNAIFVLEADGLRLAHAGDLGHPLSPEQLSAIGPLDLLMVPVGGYYTVDADGATRVVEQLNPRAVVPMHYKTPAVGPQSPLAPVDPFLEGKKVEKLTANRLELSKSKLPALTTVYVLGYQ